MTRIYEVMKAMDTDPMSFFKLVAKGEIGLVIESATADQFKPSLGFWKQVINDNVDDLPTSASFDYSEWVLKPFLISKEAKDLLVKSFTFSEALFELADSDISNPEYKSFKKFFKAEQINKGMVLRKSYIYTDYQPAQANHAPADTVENLQQQLNDARVIIAELEKKPTKQQQREQALLFWGSGKGYVKGDTIPEMTREKMEAELQAVDRVLFSANFDDFWDDQNIFKLAKGRPKSNK